MTASFLQTPYGGEEQTSLLKIIDDDLSFLWNAGNNVPLDVQAKLTDLGFTDIGVWAKVAETTAELRTMFMEEVGMKAEGNKNFRAVVSRILDSWETAKIRGQKKKEVEADQRVNDMPRRLSKNDHLELLRSFNRLHKELLENQVPAACLVEAFLDQIEDGEMVAVRLSSVPAKDEVKEDELGTARITPDGAIKFGKSVTATVPMPPNSEALRKRMKFLARAWELARIKVPTKPAIQDLAMTDWDDRVEWILGDEVYGVEVVTADRKTSFSATWIQVLEYEYQLRKKAADLVNVGKLSIKEALEAARKGR